MQIFMTFTMCCHFSYQGSFTSEILHSYFQGIAAAKFFHYLLYPVVKLRLVIYIHDLKAWS